MEEFAHRIRIRAPKSPNPATIPSNTTKTMPEKVRKSFFNPFLVLCYLFCIRGYPRGGFGHAGLDSDLPGPQKPPETSKTKEKPTQTKSQKLFF